MGLLHFDLVPAAFEHAAVNQRIPAIFIRVFNRVARGNILFLFRFVRFSELEPVTTLSGEDRSAPALRIP
jgi:hypothetical protein